MHRLHVPAIIVALLTATSAYGVVIDTFETPQLFVPAFQGDAAGVSGPGILTGWRDLGAAPFDSSVSMEASDGVLTLETGPGGGAILGMVWDGPNVTLPISPDIGFGPVDLTDGGASNAFAFTVLFSDKPVDIEFRLWQGDNRDDRIVVSIPGGTVVPQEYVIPFASFIIGSGSGIRANYSKINSVTALMWNFPPEATLQIGPIETIFVPEPSGLVLAAAGLVFTAYWARRTRTGVESVTPSEYYDCPRPRS